VSNQDRKSRRECSELLLPVLHIQERRETLLTYTNTSPNNNAATNAL
jgi:hypothetical protein